MFGLSLRATTQLLHHHVATHMKILDVHVDRCSCPYLHAIHNVTIAAVKGEVVPRPISDRANFITST